MPIFKTMTMMIVLTMNVLSVSVIADESVGSREQDFNFDWKFTLLPDTNIPKALPLPDDTWRDLRLPHDWSVEASFDENLEGATGYLPGGVGLYQKHFPSPDNLENTKTYILFDGVYNNATFFLNGEKLGFNPYGYSPVYFDLSDKLKTDGSNNTISVHVDHSRYGDSRWYTGSGIYRNVKLVTVNKLHIPIWGTFVTTEEVSSEKAKIELAITIENAQLQGQQFEVISNIISPDDKIVASVKQNEILGANTKGVFTQSVDLEHPALWDTDSPHMYRANTTIQIAGKIIDTYSTQFGIRDIKFIPQKGFFLNGKPTLMKGVSLHHDGGLVGAAVPKEVWRRRLLSLKSAGMNAVRTAHNPFSEEFLSLCDELGILVQHEFFDEFDYPKDKRLNMHERHDDYITRGYAEHFQTWAKSDLTRTMLRDRNHPSIVQWSIGNEIEWTYVHYRYITGFWQDPNDPEKGDESFWGAAPKFSPEQLKARYDASEKGEYVLAETAQRINQWVKQLDTSRPTTANFILPQVSHVSGYADAVDIVGYSYRNSVIPWAQTHFPNKIITINENPGTWDDWKQVLEHPGVFSQFMWTGIDYMGERHEKWPEKSGWGDMLDLAGFKRQGWNYFKSVWLDEPHISLGTIPLKASGFEQDPLSGLAIAENNASYRWRDSNMHWNYKDHELILVEVSSNYATVELFLNGESLGYRSMSEAPDRIFRWVVPYKSGILEAKAGFKGQKLSAKLATSGKATQFKLLADKTELKADGYDLAHIVVQLFDAQGRIVKTDNTEMSFSVSGDARWLGVDTGAADFVSDFQSKTLTTAKGRALAIVQANKTSSEVVITASAPGFKQQQLSLSIK